MQLIVLYNHAKIGKILRVVLEKRQKPKKTEFNLLRSGIKIFFQRSYMPQTMRTIVLYNIAKIGNILGAVLEKRPKIPF